MATVVETYFVEETLALLTEAGELEKWQDMVSFLNLEGQKTLSHDEKSPIPFLWLNNSLVKTFEVLCPTKVDVEKYNKTPIPLPVLELVALSFRESHFDKIQIWYDDVTPDPVCIGLKIQEAYKNKDSWYQQIYSDKYLLGRWSDVKASLAELVKRARARFVAQKKTDYEKGVKSCQRQLEDVELEADTTFGSQSAGTASFELPF